MTNEEPKGLISAATVALVVEVASSTLADDLGIKLRIYAAHGIPEYWVVDVEARVIHRMWSPGPKGYARRDVVGFGARIEAATIPELAVETSGLADAS